MLTYQEAYDLIIEAYFKDEIQPYDAAFCFCGTLNNKQSKWVLNFEDSENTNCIHYYKDDLLGLEHVFLTVIRNDTVGQKACDIFGFNCKKSAIADMCIRDRILEHPNYEQAVFNAMVQTLNKLKQIHINRGENVEEQFINQKQLVKRIL